jgi:threonine synthase
LVQAYLYGAKVIALRGNFDDALRLVRELGSLHSIEVVNSINPDRIEGQKTAAFEIIEELGDAPDLHILPVGNAGNITPIGKGIVNFAILSARHCFRACWVSAAGSRRSSQANH